LLRSKMRQIDRQNAARFGTGHLGGGGGHSKSPIKCSHFVLI
jgi:hypothetical protein